VKSALSSTKAILISLDLCNEPDPTYDLVVDENNLITQEQELLAQQQALLKKQKALEAQLKAQKELQAKISRGKEIKLAEQKKIKFEAETNLLELENVINRFIRIMDCGNSEPVSEDYSRSLEELEVESINATKAYYTQKARDMADQLIMVLADCN
jgi:ABC-type enterochelin transport system ATPase subunit